MALFNSIIPFAFIAFRANRPFQHFSAIVSTCCLQVNIPSKCIPRHHRWLLMIQLQLHQTWLLPLLCLLLCCQEHTTMFVPYLQRWEICCFDNCCCTALAATCVSLVVMHIMSFWCANVSTQLSPFHSDLSDLWCKHCRGLVRMVSLVKGHCKLNRSILWVSVRLTSYRRNRCISGLNWTLLLESSVRLNPSYICKCSCFIHMFAEWAERRLKSSCFTEVWTIKSFCFCINTATFFTIFLVRSHLMQEVSQGEDICMSSQKLEEVTSFK